MMGKMRKSLGSLQRPGSNPVADPVRAEKAAVTTLAVNLSLALTNCRGLERFFTAAASVAFLVVNAIMTQLHLRPVHRPF